MQTSDWPCGPAMDIRACRPAAGDVEAPRGETVVCTEAGEAAVTATTVGAAADVTVAEV